MRTVLAWVLLLLVPSSGIRVVCFDDHPGTITKATADDEAAAAAERECERVCARRHAAPRPPTPAQTCVLIPDPSCSFLASAGTAVMPHEPAGLSASAARPFEPAAADDYRGPLLPRSNPPPKA